MRREVHCASVATPTGVELVGDDHAALLLQDRQRLDHLVHAQQRHQSLRALPRGRVDVQRAASCGRTTSSRARAPRPVSGALCIFNYTAQSTTSLAKLTVDFPVNVKPAKTVELYELMDDLVLRNSSRS